MKYISSILLIAICILPMGFENVLGQGYKPSNAELELVESMMNLEISKCTFESNLQNPNETKLKECDENIMNYMNILCAQHGSLESGKCDRAEQYMLERFNSNLSS